jgi:hypothetical protein
MDECISGTCKASGRYEEMKNKGDFMENQYYINPIKKLNQSLYGNITEGIK